MSLEEMRQDLRARFYELKCASANPDMGELEERARQRCFVKGKLVGERLANLYREMKLLETSPRWPSILSVEKKVELELSILDEIDRDVNQAFTGFPDGLPRCFSPKYMGCWKPIVEDIRGSIERREWGEAAHRIKFGLEECLGIGMLGITVTDSLSELEYILKKRLKGERLLLEPR